MRKDFVTQQHFVTKYQDTLSQNVFSNVNMNQSLCEQVRLLLLSVNVAISIILWMNITFPEVFYTSTSIFALFWLHC